MEGGRKLLRIKVKQAEKPYFLALRSSHKPMALPAPVGRTSVSCIILVHGAPHPSSSTAGNCEGGGHPVDQPLSSTRFVPLPIAVPLSAAETPGRFLKSHLRTTSGRGRDEKTNQGRMHSPGKHGQAEMNSTGVGKLLAGRDGRWWGGGGLLEMLRWDFGQSCGLPFFNPILTSTSSLSFPPGSEAAPGTLSQPQAQQRGQAGGSMDGGY